MASDDAEPEPAEDPEQPAASAGSNSPDDGDVVGDGAAADTSAPRASVPWLFLLGFLLFVASAVAFAADLATGHDIQRSLAVNLLAAISLVTWAGIDSYTDEDSGVQSAGGAVGTGLILIGLYLLLAGIVVAVTSVIHDRLFVGLAMLGFAVPLILGGFLAFPRDQLPVGEDRGSEGSEPDDAGGDDPPA